MDAGNVTIATASDRDRAIQTVTLGFLSDPFCRWTWPEPDVYLEVMPRFVNAFGGRSFECGSAYIADAYRAVALWLPPGIAPDDDTIGVILAETVAPDVMSDLESIFERVAEFQPNDQPYWYLPLIATDPGFTGQGLGSAILAPALRRCDEDGMVAYLESSNPRNLSLYKRHGFEVIGEIQAGTSPKLYPMLRQPAQ